MAKDDGIELLGAPGSPYTRKMLALLRYRRIAHRVHWGGRHEALTGYPRPKVPLLPTFYFPDAHGEREAVIDSSFSDIVRTVSAWESPASFNSRSSTQTRCSAARSAVRSAVASDAASLPAR